MTTTNEVVTPEVMTTPRETLAESVARLRETVKRTDKAPVQFTMGTTVAACLDAEMGDLAPSLAPVKGYLVSTTRGDAVAVFAAMVERAEGGRNGFGHTKAERHALLQSARRLLAVLAASVAGDAPAKGRKAPAKKTVVKK
jgi:hypothetical protein